MKEYDYVVIGAGIIGLNLAKVLKEKYPNATICIIEKESQVAYHGSGRNSGVLHAGFYYTANSLKAKFTKDGNRALRDFCKEKNLKINECAKVVVAQNEKELEGLEELKQRALNNEVALEWVDEKDLADLTPYAKTFKKALFSPTTATVDPKEVCEAFALHVKMLGVEIRLNEAYEFVAAKGVIATTKGLLSFKKLINAAGLYADKIAHDFGFGKEYTIIPFKGIYLKDINNKGKLNTNIYPVPNLKNPFLGVHYTNSVQNEAKIGPTAIPAFWRENYKGFENFNFLEAIQILFYEAKLFLKNAFGFRSLAIEEIKKYRKSYFLNLAKTLTHTYDHTGFTQWSKPGIRAQLLNKNSLELVQDFVVKGDKRSVHVLNAVSPAFTCSMPFARWVVENYVEK